MGTSEDVLVGESAQRMTRLFRRAKHMGTEVVRVRSSANSSAVSMIRALEAELQLVLCGEKLRGLPNLILTVQSVPLNGLLVNSTKECLPPDGREVLILGWKGQLLFARFLTVEITFGGARYALRPVADEDLSAAMLDPISRAICEALERHLVASSRVAENYARVAILADRLSDALGMESRFSIPPKP